MHLDIYGSKIKPFNITADPHFFFESTSHKEALAALSYGLHEKKGILLITGEVGTGKTTLCKAMLEKLSDTFKTSLILNPCFSELELLSAIIEDFGLTAPRSSRLEIVKTLNAFLLDVNLSGGTAVVVIDEAQNLSSRQLEQVRLLSNLETAQEKLLQIVLLGQPELDEKLKRDNLRQLRQRIFVRHRLTPLNEAEVSKYVEFRLTRAGIAAVSILPEAYALIYQFSSGIPRLINMVCDRLMLLGFVKEKKVFDADMVQACITELRT